MSRHRISLTLSELAWSTACALSLVACRGSSSADADAGTKEAPPVTVNRAPVTEVSVPITLRLTGTLRGDRETELAANASGRVIATDVERGAQVTAGQVLAKLDVRAAALSATEARAQAESTRAQDAQAKSECARYEMLVQNRAISTIEYEQKMTQCRTLPLSVEAATARARLAAQNVGDGAVRAPFAGVVTERHVEVGRYVQRDTPVVTLVSLDPLRLELGVPEAEVAQVKVGAEIAFRVSAYPEQTFKGQIRFVSGAVRPATRELVVEAVVDNAERRLLPGMFADVELVTGTRKLPSVPRAALLARDGLAHAFFVVQGRLEERVLAVGPDAGDRRSVTKGAVLGEQVVLGDLKALSNGQRVR